MDSELTQQISNLSAGEHLCVFYKTSPVEQMSALIPFIKEGFSQQEQFIYIADDHTVNALEDRLRQSGVDVPKERDCGLLKFWTRREWRQWGESCTKKKSLQLLDFVDEAAKFGFKGVRFAVEMAWTLGSDIRPSQFMQWEAMLNDVFLPGVPAKIICQYHWSRFSSETMLVALQNHPVAVIGDIVYPNWFYQASSITGETRDDGSLGSDWMISILQRSRDAQQTKMDLESGHRRLQEIEVLAAIGTAATQIAHDMTNPLNAISTTIQLQERYVEKRSDRLPELMSGALRDLKDEANRIRELIDELRHFSQPLQLKLEATNLCQLMHDVAQEAASSRNHPDRIEFEQLELSDDLPPIMADGEKLRRVLLNLFKNAVEAMPEGGKLALKCTMQENNICLEIQDTGCGVPKEMKIFEPFATSKPNGWGLGLAIAQQIISAHKGVIGYNSEPDKGTTFKILLPTTNPSGAKLPS